MLAYISIPVLDIRRKCHKHILHCFSLNTMFSTGKVKQENVMHEMGLPLATVSAFEFVFSTPTDPFFAIFISGRHLIIYFQRLKMDRTENVSLWSPHSRSGYYDESSPTDMACALVSPTTNGLPACTQKC